MDNKLTPREILEKIIANNGSCSWTNDTNDACKDCPIGRLSFDENGNPMSCLDVVFAEPNSTFILPEQQNKNFKERAMDMLANMMIEDALVQR